MTHLLEAAEAGATIVTGNRRAARSLRLSYDRRQVERGREAWRSPDILPWPALVARLWEQLAASNISLPVVLSAAQERALWRDVIRADGQSDSGASTLAPLAMTAWKLLHDYLAKPKAEEMQATTDTAAFARWISELSSQVKSKNFITQAETHALVMRAIQAGGIALPKQIIAVGFDEPAPQQQKSVAALEACGVKYSAYSPETAPCTPVAIKAPDPLCEIELAARWARAQVERGANSVGVIVPDIETCRTDIDRVFRMFLQAEVMLPGAAVPPAFHISLGRRLSEWPMINIALLLLQWLETPLPIEDIGILLRSSFIAGAEEERWARACLDAELRRRGGSRLTMRDVAELAGRNGKSYYCRTLTQALIAKRTQIDVAEKRSAAEWAQALQGALAAFGWPAGRLSSAEFQCHSRWMEMLSDFASLDRVREIMTFSKALAALSEAADAEAFAPEDNGAPVQIMGALEAAGSEFDALWIMRLDAERWPPKAHPSPLLPLRLQRQCNMPGCTPTRQAEFAGRVMQRLHASVRGANDAAFVLSFAATEGERELRPSPVLANGPFVSAEQIAPPAPTWYSAISRAEEKYAAHDALPFAQHDPLAASTLFRLQSACPFHAFAELRLHARELDEPEDGPGAMQRGTVTHTVMQQLWSELQTHERLTSLTSAELDTLIGRAVDAALEAHSNDFPAGEMRQPLLDLEHERLRNLVRDWLEVEKARKPFSVTEIEQKGECEIAGIRLRLRRDRVDELTDGRAVIVDYKTGKIAPHRWDGDRPDDPQLPLYAITNPDKQLAGIVFAHLKAGSMGFSGLQAEPNLIPDVEVAGDGPQAMQEQMAQWQSVLINLGEQFADGRATVDPKKREVCRNCALPALCRIAELRNNGGDSE